MRKPARTLLRRVILALVAAIVGVNVYWFNATHVAGDSVPMPFGVGAAVVLSGSMEPQLHTGDLLIIARQETYELGDVVVYQSGSITVTHRIIALTETEATTKGDANDSSDLPILRSQIKGRVVLAVPWIGYVVSAVKTPAGTLLLLALAVYLLEASLRKEKKQDRQEMDAIRDEIERLKNENNKK